MTAWEPIAGMPAMLSDGDTVVRFRDRNGEAVDLDIPASALGRVAVESRCGKWMGEIEVEREGGIRKLLMVSLRATSTPDVRVESG